MISVLDERSADRYYRERLYSESNKPDYTPEELNRQEEIKKYFEEYNAARDEKEKLLIIENCYNKLFMN